MNSYNNKTSSKPFSYYSYAQASVQDTISQLHPMNKQLGGQQVIVHSDGLDNDTLYEGIATDDSPLTIADTTLLIDAPSCDNSSDTTTRLAKQWVAANNAHREYFLASGTMRGLHVAN